MTLAAGPGQVGAVDRGTRIARRKDTVRAVAARAIGYDLRASAGRQPVIAGQVSGLAAALYSKFLRKAHAFMASAACGWADILRRDRGIGIGVGLDRVNAVAVRANGRLPVSFCNGLPVDAPLEFFRDLVVTAAAGLRNVEFKNRRLGVFRIENLVRAVAIGADRGFFRAVGNRVPMHALFVGGDHLCALAAIFHDELLTVAGAAGRGDIGVMHARLRIAGGEQFVRTPMTIDARGCVAIAALDGLGVKTALVGRLLVGVASGARNFLGRGFVSRAFYIGVAVHAGEHAAVNRIFESFRIDVQADGLAVLFVGERGVVMAGEAFVCGWFGRLFAGSVECARR